MAASEQACPIGRVDMQRRGFFENKVRRRQLDACRLLGHEGSNVNFLKPTIEDASSDLKTTFPVLKLSSGRF